MSSHPPISHTRRSLHGQWSSRWSFILATTGAAVGLGNIWKFPYMAGKNGGGVFVIIYLLCIAVVGIPLMIGEIWLGRCGRRNPVSTFSLLAHENKCSPYWQYVGWWGAATLLCILSFYSVIAGWSLAYLGYAIQGRFAGLTSLGVTRVWQTFQSSPLHLLFYHGAFMLLTLWVVARGVKKGIERASNLMMPMLLLILALLVIYASHMSGFHQGASFLLSISQWHITPSIIVEALGHAFFSLAIGVGCLLVYGAYLPQKTPIVSTTFIITAINLAVAILSGLAIFPIVFSYHLVPDVGAPLMFQTLPIAFAQMKGGHLLGALFFLLLLFAAWTSSISLLEPLVILLVERFKLTRLKAAILVGTVAWLLGIGSLLSFNAWKTYLLWHRWSFFGVIAGLSTNVMLPIGGILFAIFIGWKMPKKNMLAELKLSPVAFWVWLSLLRFVAPIGILIVLLEAFITI